MENYNYAEFDAHVDRFFKGQMDRDEERHFLAAVDSNPQLKERMIAIAMMRKSMHDIRAEESQRISDEIAAMDPETYRQRTAPAPEMRVTPWRSYIKAAVAACVAVLLIFVVVKLTRPTGNIYTQLGNSYDYYAYNTNIQDLSTRGGDLFDEATMQELAAFFKNTERGVSLQATIIALKKYLAVAQKTDSPLVDPISWNLAIAYLKSGDGEMAKSILTDMLDRNQGLYPNTEYAVLQLLSAISQAENQP